MSALLASVGHLLEEVSTRLRRGGVPHARREAHRLLTDLAGLEAGVGVLHPEHEASDDLRDRLLAAADRRANGEPMPYVSGRAGFRHLDLFVDRRVLIPRPETEQLVDLVLALAPSGRVVDVGTGSGCLALSLAAEGRYDAVTGIDRSADALAAARDNGIRLGLSVEWMAGDLLGPVQGRQFEVVVSNPPYLTAAEYRALDASVRDWEPELALVSGEDGLDATRRLLVEARDVVRPGGLLALEMDSSRAAVTAALAAAAGWQDVAVINDLFGRARFLTARRGPVS